MVKYVNYSKRNGGNRSKVLSQKTTILGQGDHSIQCSYRLAEESDEADVIDMSAGVYDGCDYLPAMFVDYCRDTSIRMLIVDVVENGIKKAVCTH